MGFVIRDLVEKELEMQTEGLVVAASVFIEKMLLGKAWLVFQQQFAKFQVSLFLPEIGLR